MSHVKTPTILLAIIALSTIAICILFALSVRPIAYSQGFSRKLPDSLIALVNSMRLPSDSYYIAGLVGDRIYLGNTADPLKLSVTDIHLGEFQTRGIKSEDKKVADGAIVEIDSPYFFIKNGRLPLIARGEIEKWKISRHMTNFPGFEQAGPIGSDSFIIHALMGTGERELRNVLLKSSFHPAGGSVPIILETERDFYSADGILRINKEMNLLVYTYMYCNVYAVIDTSLNLIYKGNTIDTITTPRIRMAKISKYAYTLASPPSRVNQNSFVYNRMLFVQSNIMGTNEHKRSFDTSSVIDVYDLVDNKYGFSFYVPDYNLEKISSFQVRRNHFIAIQGNAIINYTLRADFLHFSGTLTKDSLLAAAIRE
jgi:hypothetical protein